MEETLGKALERIFPGGARPSSEATITQGQPAPAQGEATAPPADVRALTEQARSHYQRAMQAQRDGNWALYGEEIKKLGEVLEKMRKQ